MVNLFSFILGILFWIYLFFFFLDEFSFILKISLILDSLILFTNPSAQAGYDTRSILSGV